MLAVLVPVFIVVVLILPSEIYAGIFPYIPGPIQRAAGTAALRSACADSDAGAMQSVALGYLEFSGRAAEYGKLSELIPEDVQRLCLEPEREEPLTPMMYGAMLMRGNDQEARRAIESTGHPEGYCQAKHGFPQDTERRIISTCRSLGLRARGH